MSLSLLRLVRLLALFDVDVQSWGKGNAKTINDLFEEVRRGESRIVIDEKGVHRVVEIAKMFIYDRNRPERGFLVELSQRLPDGRVRERRQQPSEKMKKGESPEETAIRGLNEELQIHSSDYTLLPLKTAIEQRPGSYPGLTCRYVVHNFEVMLDPGSPALRENFSTTERDGTTLYFGWERRI